MILFLDTVSSLPEFSIFEDNKIVYSKKILKNETEKMSDLIVSCYLEIDKKFSLDNKLNLLIINTGPGSYTALRVGIAYFYGLSISKNIKLIGIQCLDLFRYIIDSSNLLESAILINSSNNQQYICIYDEIKKSYEIQKFENNNLIFKNNLIKKLYINEDIKQLDKNIFNNIIINKINFSRLIELNLKNILSIPKNELVTPVYISNNKILN